MCLNRCTFTRRDHIEVSYIVDKVVDEDPEQAQSHRDCGTSCARLVLCEIDQSQTEADSSGNAEQVRHLRCNPHLVDGLVRE